MTDTFDEDFVAGLVGKHILVGITYVDAAVARVAIGTSLLAPVAKHCRRADGLSDG
jgi:hypothetical protein